MNRTRIIVRIAAGLVAGIVTQATWAGTIRNAREATGASATERTLWDQENICCDSGNGTISQGTPGNIYAAAADDFKVPESRLWIIDEVDVAGDYQDHRSRASSEHVTFYESRHGLPGALIADYDNLTGVRDGHGSFKIAIPETSLQGGVYWVSVVVNMTLDQGAWYWENLTPVTHHEAAFEALTFGACPIWGHQDVCFPDSPPLDQMFKLKGREEIDR